MQRDLGELKTGNKNAFDNPELTYIMQIFEGYSLV